jgi:4-amino-4-deoxy-L-arabinose transferase-like glycosyltransferase
MSQPVRYQLWIVAAATTIFFTNLGGAALWDMDEALYTSCAREMFQRGDWVVPMFNGQMFPEKPPLMFWTIMAGQRLFGGVISEEFGARFFSAVFGVATALATFHIGRILFSARAGLWAGLITASTIIFTVSARAATVDSALTLATTTAMLMFVIARRRESVGSGEWAVGSGQSAVGSEGPNLQVSKSPNLPIILMYACIGVAVLAKGPVGMVLPLAAMGLYLLAADGWRKVLRSAWWMRPFTALAVIAAVALPWYVCVGIRTDGEWLRKFFVEFNLRPFRQPILTHGDTSFLTSTLAVLVSILYYFYHVPVILVGFFPWSVFLGPTVIDVTGRIRRRDAWRDGCVLASCWFGVWLVFWSICKTKLPHYLLPAYPALALLTACFVERWQSGSSPFPRWWLRNAWISMILVGVGMMIAVPIVTAIYLPGEAVLGLLGLIPLLGGAWCWRQTAQDRRQAAAVGFVVTAVIFLTAAFGWAALRVDRHQNAKPMLAAIRADSGDAPQTPIAAYRFFRESIVYYAGHPITRCDDDEGTGQSAEQKLRGFLAGPRPSYVITITEHLPTIEKDFHGQFQEVFRRRCFGDLDANNEVIVLRFK